jgi:hypothetical protein
MVHPSSPKSKELTTTSIGVIRVTLVIGITHSLVPSLIVKLRRTDEEIVRVDV